MEYFTNFFYLTQETFGKFNIRFVDIVEIVILSFLIYQIALWTSYTRAWILLKGLAIIAVFLFIATALEMNTITWIASNSISIAITALVIILQPELRKALEDIGKNELLQRIQLGDKKREKRKFSDKTIQAITKACGEMSRVKTGALIVIENNQNLSDYISTGIEINGEFLVSY